MSHKPHPQPEYCHPATVPTPTRWSFPAVHHEGLEQRVAAALGPLSVLGSDPSVTDVFVVADGRVFADRGDGALLVTDLQLDAESRVDLARALVEAGGRHLDEASPVVDVRLAEGIRVHAALPPVALGGAVISIRFGRGPKPDIGALALGWSDAVRDQVLAAVDQRQTLLVTGATGSGKTTLLAALLAFASPRDRLVVIEDVSELRIDHPHVVQLECRQANLEGAGEVTLQRLVRESLRMRPNRLVVGECRGAELRDLLSALTTGHRGGAATLHAHSLEEVPARLDSLAALAGLTSQQLARQARSAIDLIIHVEHNPGQPREVSLGYFADTPGGELVVARY